MRLTVDSTVDLFIKTWAGDAKWLPFCLSSFDKYAKNFRQLILVTDKGFQPEISTLNLPVKLVETDFAASGYDDNPPFHSVTRRAEIIEQSPRGPGYYWQQAVKMSWPHYTDADAIVIYDTDTIAWDQFSFLDLTLDGQPYWRKKSFKSNDNNLIFKDCVESFLGQQVDTNYMLNVPTNPNLLTREATEGFAAQINERYGKSIIDFFRPTSGAPILSEYSLFGSYLDIINRHGYIMIDGDSNINTPDIPIKQYWSWGGLEPLFKDIDQALNG